MRQDLIEASREESAFLKRRLNLSQDADPACAASIGARNNRRHAGSAVKPNLNTTFRELVDLKKESAKFMSAWHYALGGRGAF